MKSIKRRPTYISLYCGCGGFDEGFLKSGFECLGGFDIDSLAIEVYNKNIGPYGHVCDLSSGKLPVAITKTIDVVISGSPCQGFSTIGKRRLNDPRNNLLLIGGKIALQLDTKIFIAENVMGSVSGKHKLYWDKLEKMFVKNDYQVQFIKCDAQNYGLPQLRKRILMIAKKKDIEINHELVKVIPTKSLKEILSNLENSNNHEVDYLKKGTVPYKIALKIKPGQKLSNVRGSDRAIHTWDIPEVFGKIKKKEQLLLLEIMKLRRKIRVRKNGDADPVKIEILMEMFGESVLPLINNLLAKGYLRKPGKYVVDLAQTFNGKYRRLNYDMPSPTVDTRFGSATYFLHPKEHRSLTVREAARIQGFRDDFIFSGPIKSQFQMIGNAVPPPVSQNIAEIVKRNF